jgi:hypothetical protein
VFLLLCLTHCPPSLHALDTDSGESEIWRQGVRQVAGMTEDVELLPDDLVQRFTYILT